MPAKAGTQGRASTAYAALDPRFRGGDGKRGMGAICLVHTTSGAAAGQTFAAARAGTAGSDLGRFGDLRDLRRLVGSLMRDLDREAAALA